MCVLYDVQSLEGCLEERGDDVPVLSSRWGGLEYLMCCMSLSVNLLFSFSSAKTTPDVKVCFREIYFQFIHPLSCPSLHLFRRIYMSLDEKGCDDIADFQVGPCVR